MSYCGDLKQSTAVTIKLGPFPDDTDGNTAEPSLTISQADVRISKNGGNIAQKSDATSCTHDELGVYDCPLNATDTNTLGILSVIVHESGALAVRQDYMVLTANAYDSKYGSDKLEVDIAEVSGDATAAANLEADYDGTGYNKSNSAIGTTAVATDVTNVVSANLTQMGGVAQSATDLKDFADAGYDPASNKVQGVVLVDTCTANTDMRGTDNAALASVLGALADAAAAGDPTSADTVMQYVKQLVNILAGTAGVTTYPAEAAPGNGVNFAEILRAIHSDVTGLDGDAMRGTDSAALATVCTEARLSELDAGTAGKMANQVDIIETDTTAMDSRASEARLSELDAGTAGKAANQIDLIKTEADKIANADAGAGVAGSVIEEIENRATPNQVNTEVSDVMKTDTVPEPTAGAAPATPTVFGALGYIYQRFANKVTIDGSHIQFHNNADTAIHKKPIADSAGTYTESKSITP